jgi:hypothetical protein
MTDAYPDEHCYECDRRRLITHQPEHQRGDRHPEPELRLDEPNAESREGQSETELQARRDAAG